MTQNEKSAPTIGFAMRFMGVRMDFMRLEQPSDDQIEIEHTSAISHGHSSAHCIFLYHMTGLWMFVGSRIRK